MEKNCLDRDTVLKKLQDNKENLRRFGVKKIGIFGSAVKNQLSKNSDIDIFVDFEKGKGTMKNFVMLADFLENLFQRKVEILTEGGIESIRLKHIKEKIKKEILYV
ncbi:MAG: nucleotidyltransferase [Aquificae bacterium]|nr:nucleotidyltransferase [Aquificota bacterium]